MFTPWELGCVGLAFSTSLLSTPLVRALARHRGMVANPKADRWHSKPTALMGGVAIFLSVAVSFLIIMPLTRQNLSLLGAGAFLWLVGLIDDLYHLKPYQKLIAQVMAAALVLSLDLTLRWTPYPLANALLTVFWLVGLCNAVNLLDNMDGLAAGVSMVASVFLGIHFVVAAQPDEALLLFSVAAVLAGFLVFNWHPASIFMGDCGALFLGFFLGSVALLSTGGTPGRSHSLLPVVVVPALVLVIPIFDTFFVMVLRKLVGRRAFQGGRDHTSHRLVALGLSEPHAVALLLGLASLAGVLSLFVRRASTEVALGLMLSFCLGLVLLGIRLAQVKVYDEAELVAARKRRLVSFLVDLSYKRRIFEVSLDLCLIGVSFTFARTLILGPVRSPDEWNSTLEVLATLVFLEMAVFLVMGVYRGMWRYVGLHDLVVHVKAVTVGSVVVAIALWLWGRLENCPPALLTLNALLLLGALSGSRLMFRLLRQFIPDPACSRGRCVLIYGASDEGERLARQMLIDASLGCKPVGFVDDDPRVVGKWIHGLPVLGSGDSLERACRKKNVSELVIPGMDVPDARLRELMVVCKHLDVTLKRMQTRIEVVCDVEIG